MKRSAFSPMARETRVWLLAVVCLALFACAYGRRRDGPPAPADACLYASLQCSTSRLLLDLISRDCISSCWIEIKDAKLTLRTFCFPTLSLNLFAFLLLEIGPIYHAKLVYKRMIVFGALATKYAPPQISKVPIRRALTRCATVRTIFFHRYLFPS